VGVTEAESKTCGSIDTSGGGILGNQCERNGRLIIWWLLGFTRAPQGRRIGVWGGALRESATGTRLQRALYLSHQAESARGEEGAQLYNIAGWKQKI